jgi:hypothetical protein
VKSLTVIAKMEKGDSLRETLYGQGAANGQVRTDTCEHTHTHTHTQRERERERGREGETDTLAQTHTCGDTHI